MNKPKSLRKGVVGVVAVLILLLLMFGMTIVLMSQTRAMEYIRRIPQYNVNNAYYVQSDTELDVVISIAQISGSRSSLESVVLKLVSGENSTLLKLSLGRNDVTVFGLQCGANVTASRATLFTGASTNINVTIVCNNTIPPIDDVYGVVIFDKNAIAFTASEVG